MRQTFRLTAMAALLATTSAVAQTTPPPATPEVMPPPATDVTPPATEMAPPVVTPAPSNSAGTTASAPVLSDEQAKALKDRVIYSSDDKNVGEVAGIKRDMDGRVIELHADIGGFLGLGETRVRVMPEDFQLMADRVVVTKTADQIKTLPQIVN